MSRFSLAARRALAHTSLWLVAGAGAAASLHHWGWASGFAAWLWALPMSLLLGAMAASARHLGRWPGAAPSARGASPWLWMAASVCAGALWAGAGWFWNLFGGFALQPKAEPLLRLVPEGLGLLLGVGATAYLVALLWHDSVWAKAQLAQAREREASSQLQAREAQMQLLRAQINPHFLFNSLNSISALTTQNPKAAREMTLELAAFFRSTLQSMAAESVPLAQELALCQHFLAVEAIRFGDRLQTQVDIEPEAQAALLPAMLLQPCVENAVKHGIAQRAGGGCIELSAKVRGGWLYLTVRNPVDDDAPVISGTGTGLANIAQRLRALFGERARVHALQSGGCFEVEIVLPFETDPKPAVAASQ